MSNVKIVDMITSFYMDTYGVDMYLSYVFSEYSIIIQ